MRARSMTQSDVIMPAWLWTWLRPAGLSHRSGHGIGLDGHESVNLVHREKTPLAAGMCFPGEPAIYVSGTFGVRLEDGFHMTGASPDFFSQPPNSIDEPV